MLIGYFSKNRLRKNAIVEHSCGSHSVAPIGNEIQAFRDDAGAFPEKHSLAEQNE